MVPSPADRVVRYAFTHRLEVQEWTKVARQLLVEHGQDHGKDLVGCLLSHLSASAAPIPLLESYLRQLILSPPQTVSLVTFVACFSDLLPHVDHIETITWNSLLLSLLHDVINSSAFIKEFKPAKMDAERQLAVLRLCHLLCMLIHKGATASQKQTGHVDGIPSLMESAALNGSTMLQGNTNVLDMSLEPTGTTPVTTIPDSNATPVDIAIHANGMDLDPSMGLLGEHGHTDGNLSSNMVLGMDMSKQQVNSLVVMNANAEQSLIAANTITCATIIGRLGEMGLLSPKKSTFADRKSAELSNFVESCYAALFPVGINPKTIPLYRHEPVQKALAIVSRIAHKQAKSRFVTHFRYRQLEDEGTARAIPSAALIGLFYNIVRIRPVLSDHDIVVRLQKLQERKGASDEAFFLELMLSAIIGLAESYNWMYEREFKSEEIRNFHKDDSLRSTYNLKLSDPPSAPTLAWEDELKRNCQLWRAMVLIKLPHLIAKLIEMGDSQADNKDDYPRMLDDMSTDNRRAAFRIGLQKLSAFSGLLHSATPPASRKKTEQPPLDFLSFGTPSSAQEALHEHSNFTESSSHSIYEDLIKVFEHAGFLARNEMQEYIAVVHQATGANVPNDMNPSLGSAVDLDVLMETPKKSSKEMTEELERKRHLLDSVDETSSEETVMELANLARLDFCTARQSISVLLKIFQTHAKNRSLESVAAVGSIFLKQPYLLDLVFLLQPPKEFITPLEDFLNHWSIKEQMRNSNIDVDYEDIENLKEAYRQYGLLWALLIEIFGRYKFHRHLTLFLTQHEGFCYLQLSGGSEAARKSLNDLHDVWQQWMDALFGNEGISDSLVSASPPQCMIAITPKIFRVAFAQYRRGELNTEALSGGLSYFTESFLSYALVPNVLNWFCEELGFGAPNANMLLSLFKSLLDAQDLVPLFSFTLRRGIGTCISENKERLTSTNTDADISVLREELDAIQAKIFAPYSDIAREQLDREPESFSRKRRREAVKVAYFGEFDLFRQTRQMFGGLTLSWRDKYNRYRNYKEETGIIVEGDPATCLDMSLFQLALEVGGPRWFGTMIIEEILIASKVGGAIRAAELGAALITTPITVSPDLRLHPPQLVRTLLTDLIPTFLISDPPLIVSYFQGQTLGVFISDCLMLSSDPLLTVPEKHFKNSVPDMDTPLASWFLHNVVPTSSTGDTQTSYLHTKIDASGHLLCRSSGWRGFITGLLSNELVLALWNDIKV